GNDNQWRKFCDVAGRPDLSADPRFTSNPLRVQHRAEVVPLVEAVLRQKTTKQWQDLLDETGVPCAPVWTYAGLFAQPQAEARGLKMTVRDPDGRPVELIGAPFHIAGTMPPTPTAPPRLSQHTDEVLREVLGVEERRLEELRRRGVI